MSGKPIRKCLVNCAAVLLTAVLLLSACGGQDIQNEAGALKESSQIAEEAAVKQETQRMTATEKTVTAESEAAAKETEPVLPKTAGSAASAGTTRPAFTPGKESGFIVGVTLEPVGRYEVSEAGEPDAASLQTDTGKWMEAMYTGNTGFSYLQDDYFAVAGGGEEINQVGLFTRDGEQLIPFEAALIQRLSDHSGEAHGRYFSVCYATEVTEDRSEALLYTSDGFFIGQGIPGSKDTMYKGYIRFYDSVLRRFVPDVTGSDFNSSCGDLLVLTQNGTQNTRVFDPDGNLLMEETAIEAGNGYLIKGQHEVYDQELILRLTSGTRLDAMISTSGYLKQQTEGGIRVIDPDGNPVIPDVFSEITSEMYGMIKGKDTDGSYVLIDMQGRVLARTSSKILDLCAGYFYYESDGGYTLVGPDGIIADHLPYRPFSTMQICDGIDSSCSTLVIQTGEFSLPFGRTTDLCLGVASERNQDTKRYGLYDLFTGEKLLENEYTEQFRSRGRFLIARKDTTCDVYWVNYLYR